jgi:uncharacterized protein YbaR (Trm112 family)
MREGHLRHLVCPMCHGDLAVDKIVEKSGDVVRSGELRCCSCEREYPVVRSVPRFAPVENYASSFGYEWTRHARTQYDSCSGIPVSENRFFEETCWGRDLRGQIIAEIGSGSGRFTEQAASTGALILSLDYSYAVEANYASNGWRENVCIVQGDVCRMPFRRRHVDKVFCFGVLQHTADVRESFMALTELLVPGGELVVDLYRKGILSTYLQTKYYVRPLTRRMSSDMLYRMVVAWVELMWPVCEVIGRLPVIGASINWRLLVGDYRGLSLPGDSPKQWAILDTFDMLAPRYDSPQRIETIREWFDEAGLVESDVRYGFNGIQAKGRARHKR